MPDLELIKRKLEEAMVKVSEIDHLLNDGKVIRASKKNLGVLQQLDYIRTLLKNEDINE